MKNFSKSYYGILDRQHSNQPEVFLISDVSSSLANKITEKNPVVLGRKGLSKEPIFIIYASSPEDAVELYRQYKHLNWSSHNNPKPCTV